MGFTSILKSRKAKRTSSDLKSNRRATLACVGEDFHNTKIPLDALVIDDAASVLRTASSPNLTRAATSNIGSSSFATARRIGIRPRSRTQAQPSNSRSHELSRCLSQGTGEKASAEVAIATSAVCTRRRRALIKPIHRKAVVMRVCTGDAEAENAGDRKLMSASVGDIVTISTKVSAHMDWWLAIHDHTGSIGHLPKTHLRILNQCTPAVALRDVHLVQFSRPQSGSTPGVICLPQCSIVNVLSMGTDVHPLCVVQEQRSGRIGGVPKNALKPLTSLGNQPRHCANWAVVVKDCTTRTTSTGTLARIRKDQVCLIIERLDHSANPFAEVMVAMETRHRVDIVEGVDTAEMVSEAHNTSRSFWDDLSIDSAELDPNKTDREQSSVVHEASTSASTTRKSLENTASYSGTQSATDTDNTPATVRNSGTAPPANIDSPQALEHQLRGDVTQTSINGTQDTHAYASPIPRPSTLTPRPTTPTRLSGSHPNIDELENDLFIAVVDLSLIEVLDPVTDEEMELFDDSALERIPTPCAVCLNVDVLPRYAILECHHSFHLMCLIDLVRYAINNRVESFPVHCPLAKKMGQCSVVLDYRTVKGLSDRAFDVGVEGLSIQELDKFGSFYAESLIGKGNRIFCPDAACGVMIEIPEGHNPSYKRTRCPSCAHAFCFDCKNPWHSKMTCAEACALPRAHHHSIASTRLIAATSKACPYCGTNISHWKGHGCHHILVDTGCPGCGKHFCYACLGSYNVDGTDRCACSRFCDEKCGCLPCPDCKPGDHCMACDNDGRCPV